jgi:hypothetical protein
MFFMKSNSVVLNCDVPVVFVVVFVVVGVLVVVFVYDGTKILVHRSEVKLVYELLIIFLSALIIISITYHLNSRLNGLSLFEITLLANNASKCLAYRFVPPLYLSHRNTLESVVPNMALFTCPSGVNVVAGVPFVFNHINPS